MNNQNTNNIDSCNTGEDNTPHVGMPQAKILGEATKIEVPVNNLAKSVVSDSDRLPDNNLEKSVVIDSEMISAYMRSLAIKSNKVQKKKYGKQKFIDMAKKAGEVHHAKKLERDRLKGIENGDIIEQIKLT